MLNSIDSTLCRPQGELDIHGVPALRELLGGATGNLVVDLSAVTFVDSASLGVIVSAIRRVTKNGGTVRLRSPRPGVARVLHVVGLESFVEA
jgi:anti-anti-sigma factor